jgi:hypothetical protein
MIWSPPSLATDEEIIKRIEAGAKTMAEIDPEFANMIIPYGTKWFHKLFRTKVYKRIFEDVIVNHNKKEK